MVSTGSIHWVGRRTLLGWIEASHRGPIPRFILHGAVHRRPDAFNLDATSEFCNGRRISDWTAIWSNMSDRYGRRLPAGVGSAWRKSKQHRAEELALAPTGEAVRRPTGLDHHHLNSTRA